MDRSFRILYRSFLFFNLILIFVIDMRCYSQGVYYWSQNYGTRSNLLGGMVIGSVNDVTATYYNPGYLGLVEDPEIIIGSRIYELNNYKISFDEFEDESLSSRKFSASPSFFAGSFKLDSTRTFKFFYSFLVRQFSDVNFSFKFVDNASSSNEYKTFVREIYALRDLSENWLGISWAFSPLKNVGIGFSPYLVIRSDELRLNNNLSSANIINSVTTAQGISEYKYYNLRILAKMGILWVNEPFTLGINMTTSSINLGGEGHTYINLNVSDQISEDGSVDNGILIADYQENLHSQYKNSLNLGIGCSYSFGKSRLHFNAEWFDEVLKFNILEPQSFLVPGTDQEFQNTISLSLKSVLNFGIGYELYLSEIVSLYGSFFVDHNANKDVSRFDLFDVDLTINHLTSGANIKMGTTYLTLGLELAYGSHPFDTDMGIEKEMRDLVSILNGELTYYKIKGMLSASFLL